MTVSAIFKKKQQINLKSNQIFLKLIKYNYKVILYFNVYLFKSVTYFKLSVY